MSVIPLELVKCESGREKFKPRLLKKVTSHKSGLKSAFDKKENPPYPRSDKYVVGALTIYFARISKLLHLYFHTILTILYFDKETKVSNIVILFS